MEMDALGTTFFALFQYLSLICAILALVFIIKRVRLNKCWFWDIPVILLIIHGIIYYSWLFIVRFTPLETPSLFFSSWSTALRFHGFATLLILAVANYIKEKKKWGKS